MVVTSGLSLAFPSMVLRRARAPVGPNVTGPADRRRHGCVGVSSGHAVVNLRQTGLQSIAEHVLAIPGTGNPDHLAENIAAGTLRLSSDELTSLE
jgi:pyridoxine 4-dehydrogenase